MKKKNTISSKDKKDWIAYTENMSDVVEKESDKKEEYIHSYLIKKLDLHGFPLDKANKMVRKFIIDSFNEGYEKILVITGKGSRSRSHDNPYVSEELSVLKNSIPEFIRTDDDLNSKIRKISKADQKYGGEGAMFIFLKRKITK